MKRGAMASDYMHWAKHQAPARLRLSSSEVPHFRLDRLDFDIADLDLDGASTPLRAFVALLPSNHGVDHDQV